MISLLERYGGLAFTLILLGHVLRLWILDIQFYRKNNWDYSKDSGRHIRPGAAGLRGMRPYSNEKKMKVVYPRTIFAILVFTGIALFAIFQR